MTFTPNMPSTGQSLGFTRQLVQDNFTNYNTVVSVNHIAPNSSGQGKHKFLQMPDQASAPTVAANELGVYGKAVSGASRLFLRQENNGTEVQLTGIDPLSATIGYTFLPGSLLLQWGQLTGAHVTFNITYGVPFSAPAYSIIVTPFFAISSALSWAITASAADKFSVKFNPALNGTVNWIAIGPA